MISAASLNTVLLNTVLLNTVLLDLDGVIRHFDPAHVAGVEARHGLAPGALREASFAPEVIGPVITGKVTRREWVQQVGELVGNAAAAAEWMAHSGVVDTQVIVLVDRLRDAGTTVAILTNGTDTIPAEMEALGLVAHFDAIFNTATIGYAKPDVRAFQAVCHQLAVDPTTVFFTDDSAAKLAGAQELGMTTHHFTGIETLHAKLTNLGLLPSDVEVAGCE